MAEGILGDQYERGGLGERILQAVAARGGDPDAPTADDLAPFEEFHTGGRVATMHLAALAGIGANDEVLDVGAGVGGPARVLARRHGCRVTALDLTEEMCRAAEILTARSGMADRVQVVRGNALDLPFGDGRFDVVWTQHAAMNIPDKAMLYREARRVLRHGGRLAVHDVMAGPGGPVRAPVPWAQIPERSFLASPEEVRGLIEDAGFTVSATEDRTGEALAFYDMVLGWLGEGAVPTSGLTLLMDDPAERFANLRRSAWEERVRVVKMVATAV